MSDFVQMMKDWRRMCHAMVTDDGCNNDCPLLHISPDGRGCDAIYADEFSDNVDWSKLEQIVKKWAAEHPEPVYPTWADYISMLVKKDISTGKISGPDTVLTYAMKTPIPADIAQKLEVKPKENE